MKKILHFCKNYIKFLMNFSQYRRVTKKYPVKVMKFEATVNKIITEKLSVARFGDGEFRWMLLKEHGNTFEMNSVELSDELKRVISLNDDRLLICLPNVYERVDWMKFYPKVFWLIDVSKSLPSYHSYLNVSYTYGDALITRPYRESKISYKTAQKRFETIRMLWQDRPVLIVEGRLTRFGMGNDLLSNATKVERILCPAKNSFEKIEDIYTLIEKYLHNGHQHNLLILTALGPTATVLAANISEKLNVQTIDIGHLDVEYEWFKIHAKDKVAIKGKYVNESKEQYIDGKVDQEYLNSIVGEV